MSTHRADEESFHKSSFLQASTFVTDIFSFVLHVFPHARVRVACPRTQSPHSIQLMMKRGVVTLPLPADWNSRIPVFLSPALGLLLTPPPTMSVFLSFFFFFCSFFPSFFNLVPCWREERVTSEFGGCSWVCVYFGQMCLQYAAY